MTNSATDATQKPKRQHTNKAILAALHETAGMVYLAARRLDCNPKTLYRRIKNSPALQEAIEKQEGELLDIAESQLRRKIVDGDADTIKWWLPRKGKKRGYGDRSELTGADGGPIVFADVKQLLIGKFTEAAADPEAPEVPAQPDAG